MIKLKPERLLFLGFIDGLLIDFFCDAWQHYTLNSCLLFGTANRWTAVCASQDASFVNIQTFSKKCYQAINNS